MANVFPVSFPTFQTRMERRVKGAIRKEKVCRKHMLIPYLERRDSGHSIAVQSRAELDSNKENHSSIVGFAMYQQHSGWLDSAQRTVEQRTSNTKGRRFVSIRTSMRDVTFAKQRSSAITVLLGGSIRIVI